MKLAFLCQTYRLNASLEPTCSLSKEKTHREVFTV